MEGHESFSAAAIDAEYKRLGHAFGWRLLTCPADNIASADIALIGVNPGGSKFEAPLWAPDKGSAYVTESWKNYPPGEERLQRQIRRMFAIMSVNPAEVLSGYLVPFRSQNWNALPEKSASIDFGKKIWREILGQTGPRTVIAFGKDIAPHVAEIVDARDCHEFQAAWGNQTIDVYRFDGNGKLVVLPHLSRFALFNRPASEAAFRHALLA